VIAAKGFSALINQIKKSTFKTTVPINGGVVGKL
jgi:hypothetical protein